MGRAAFQQVIRRDWWESHGRNPYRGTTRLSLFKSRHWGGYHFPRHFNLFNRRALASLAQKCGYEVDAIRTIVSPVNWTYSLRNALEDYGAPRWLIEQFSLKTPVTLGAFTLLDTVYQVFGRGALLQAVLRRPR